MLILVSGGSASGKSAFAESLVAEHPCRDRYYVATMQVWDKESEKRVERHRAMRADKGFITVEQTCHLEQLQLPDTATVLVEDLSNWAANECFSSEGVAGAVQRMSLAVDSLADRSGLTVLVGCELFSDGISYPAETQVYLDCLAELHCYIAQQADVVWEVVAGLPHCWKGGVT